MKDKNYFETKLAKRKREKESNCPPPSTSSFSSSCLTHSRKFCSPKWQPSRIRKHHHQSANGTCERVNVAVTNLSMYRNLSYEQWVTFPNADDGSWTVIRGWGYLFTSQFLRWKCLYRPLTDLTSKTLSQFLIQNRFPSVFDTHVPPLWCFGQSENGDSLALGIFAFSWVDYFSFEPQRDEKNGSNTVESIPRLQFKSPNQVPHAKQRERSLSGHYYSTSCSLSFWPSYRS